MQLKESNMSPTKILYTAKSTATGGRDGRAVSSSSPRRTRSARIPTPRAATSAWRWPFP